MHLKDTAERDHAGIYRLLQCVKKNTSMMRYVYLASESVGVLGAVVDARSLCGWRRSIGLALCWLGQVRILSSIVG